MIINTVHTEWYCVGTVGISPIRDPKRNTVFHWIQMRFLLLKTLAVLRLGIKRVMHVVYKGTWPRTLSLHFNFDSDYSVAFEQKTSQSWLCTSKSPKMQTFWTVHLWVSSDTSWCSYQISQWISKMSQHTIVTNCWMILITIDNKNPISFETFQNVKLR